MRILILNQFCWPDVAPTAQYLGDLARHLSAEGHDVTVICSGESYAGGQRSTNDGTTHSASIKIITVPGRFFKQGTLGRLFSYAAFFAGALWHSLRIRRVDKIVTMTTPPMLSVVGAIVKAIRGSRHYIWEMDLFPEALVTLGGLTEAGVVTRILASLQSSVRRRSDGIIVLGPCMRNRLLTAGIPETLVHVAENWADGESITPGPNRRTGPLNVFYSGNLGRAHDNATIASAIRRFRNDPRFLFTFAGGGIGRAELELMCREENVSNVQFLPYAEKTHLNEHLAQADIGLVTVRSSCIGTVVPSKVYGLMAAGRPVLFVGPKGATPSLVIEKFKCGWQIEPGDDLKMTSLLEFLSGSREHIWESGARARAAFEKHYDLPLGVARVAGALGIGPSRRAQFPRTASGPKGQPAIRAAGHRTA